MMPRCVRRLSGRSLLRKGFPIVLEKTVRPWTMVMHMANGGFNGKVVLVTGAAGGIGRAICARFESVGARVGARRRRCGFESHLPRDLEE